MNKPNRKHLIKSITATQELLLFSIILFVMVTGALVTANMGKPATINGSNIQGVASEPEKTDVYFVADSTDQKVLNAKSIIITTTQKQDGPVNKLQKLGTIYNTKNTMVNARAELSIPAAYSADFDVFLVVDGKYEPISVESKSISVNVPIEAVGSKELSIFYAPKKPVYFISEMSLNLFY